MYIIKCLSLFSFAASARNSVLPSSSPIPASILLPFLLYGDNPGPAQEPETDKYFRRGPSECKLGDPKTLK
jgi:hypothetical protein